MNGRTVTQIRAFVLAAAVGAAIPGLALAQAQPQIERGNQVFQYWCSNCHGAGVGKPGTMALAAKYHGERPALLEQRTDLTPAMVKLFVRTGISIMPIFRKTEIGEADLDAVAAYLDKSGR